MLNSSNETEYSDAIGDQYIAKASHYLYENIQGKTHNSQIHAFTLKSYNL